MNRRLCGHFCPGTYVKGVRLSLHVTSALLRVVG